MKHRKQTTLKAASRKQRGKSAKRAARAQCGDQSPPAWPSLAQLRDRLQSIAVAETDGYGFEKSL